MTIRVESGGKISLLRITWRAVVVGIGYLVLLVLGGALLVSLGVSLPQREHNTELLPWILISGFAIGLVLGSFASRMSASRSRHAFVWISLLFLNSVGILIEGLFFVPDLISLESVPGCSTVDCFAWNGDVNRFTFHPEIIFRCDKKGLEANLV